MSETVFIEPLDVLYLRGNQLFEGAGAYSTPLMPPWPSLAAGALRSRMMADAGVDTAAFRNGKAAIAEPLDRVLGTLEQPGTFTLTHFSLARREERGVEPIYPLPTDLVVTGNESEVEAVYRLGSNPLPEGVRGSTNTAELGMMKSAHQKKRLNDCWLSQSGMEAWVKGSTPSMEHLIRSSALWGVDHRLGISLDESSRTAQEGQLYTADTVSLHESVGFCASVSGTEGSMPFEGLLRFGGDGRGARVSRASWESLQPDWEKINHSGAFRLLLTTPGLFPDGWRLPGQTKQNRWCWQGIEAELLSASVNRHSVISGWDLARWQPKRAQRVVPTGAVYTLQLKRGGIAELQELIEQGLPLDDKQRRAEGFNRIIIANR